MLDAPDGGGYRWRMRPASPLPEIAAVDLQVCDRCGLCLPLCPPEAIHLALADLVVDRARATASANASPPAPSAGPPWSRPGAPHRWGGPLFWPRGPGCRLGRRGRRPG